jgi:hypothetical protein
MATSISPLKASTLLPFRKYFIILSGQVVPITKIMKYSPTAPFSFRFFERIINLLVVVKISERDAVFRGLNCYKPYKIDCVFSSRDANALLTSNKRFHVCLCDLSFFDGDANELSLMQNYPPAMPMIIMADPDSVTRGFHIRNLETLAVLQKPVDFRKLHIIELINEAFLQTLLKTSKMGHYKPVILNAIESFIVNRPKMVKEWVKRISVEERYLRKIWSNCFGYQPRHAIMLYNALFEAFRHFNSRFVEETASNGKYSTIDAASEEEYRHLRFKVKYGKYQDFLEKILKIEVRSFLFHWGILAVLLIDDFIFNVI